MALRRFSTSGITAGTKSSKVWDGETFPGYFESIATVISPSAGSSTVTFNNIPNTYAHLQIRAIARTDRASNVEVVKLQFNSDTGSNYSAHQLYGTGSAAGGAANVSSETYIQVPVVAGASPTSGIFGAFVWDILDYANTNKYKTLRGISGVDINGSGGELDFNSGSWRSTSAITDITIAPRDGTKFVQYSHFALYGIRSA